MSESERESNREFVLRWKRVGPLLEEIREQKLVNMTEKDAQFEIKCVLGFATQIRRPPRFTSGLVELQKLLARQQS